jgi:hypothetical protein
VVAGTKATAANAAGLTGKSHIPAVPFNGKNLAPQSLIQRKSGGGGGHKKNKVDRTFVDKNDTIEEDAPDDAEKPILPTTRTKRYGSSSAIIHRTLANPRVFLTRLESSAGLSSHAQSSATMHSGSKASVGSSSSMAHGKNKNVVEEFCTIQLNETPTAILFSMPSLVVASDTREIMVTDERNARYEAVIKSHSNVDGFFSRPTQTKNLPQKNQLELAAPNALREAGTQASAYDIKDATSGTESSAQDAADAVVAGTDGHVEELSGLNPTVRKFVTDTVGAAVVTPGCLLDTTNVLKPLGAGEQASQAKPSKHKTKLGVAKSTAMTSTAGGGASGDDHNNSDHFGAEAAPAVKKADSGSASNAISASSGNNNEPVVNPSGVMGSRANESSDNPDGIAGGEGTNFSAEDSQELMREAEIKQILSNPLLLKRLHMVERAIQQNANHRPQLDYRDLPDIQPLSLLSSERAKALREAAEVSCVCLSNMVSCCYRTRRHNAQPSRN